VVARCSAKVLPVEDRTRGVTSLPGDDVLDGTIRQVLADHGKLLTDAGGVGATDDLYVLGLTSHGCVNVMLALEEHFDVEFLDQLLKAETFASIAAIRGALYESGVPRDDTDTSGSGD